MIPSTDKPLTAIPDMPASEASRWHMVWRMLGQLQNQNELTMMELMLYKSQEHRVKWAGQYAEEAVARVYGIDRLDFYGIRSLGRATAEKAIIAEARFILYNVLYHLFGVPIVDLQRYYDNNTRNYVDRWKPIFDLVHKPRPISDPRKQADYDRYAPRYHATYKAMRQAMVDDGVWRSAYNDPTAG